MNDVYIAYAKRTPIGKLNGLLSPVRVDDLMAHLFKNFKEWSNFDLKKIDDVMVGCANQAGEDNRNVARMASLLAEFPYEVPGTTINRLCGSSLDAAIGAWCRIQSGLADCIVVGGTESMTRAPYALSKSDGPWGRNQKIYDTTFGWRFPNPKMEELFPLYGMGQTAEEVQSIYKISRDKQDQFALSSHQKASEAWDSGKFNDEVESIFVQKNRKQSYTVEKDEGPRKDTNIEKLSKLKAAFKKDGTVTAGNSSMMNDGSSMVLLVSEKFLKDHNLTPIVKITGAGIRGLHPNTMGLGPVHATQALCEKYGKKVDDFDVIELNEAFAVQSLACIEELKIDENKVNLRGGAIALGHPLGCSGTRILTTLTHIMKDDSKLKQGLATMCIGVGQGVALSVENCQ